MRRRQNHRTSPTLTNMLRLLSAVPDTDGVVKLSSEYLRERGAGPVGVRTARPVVAVGGASATSATQGDITQIYDGSNQIQRLPSATTSTSRQRRRTLLSPTILRRP